MIVLTHLSDSPCHRTFLDHCTLVIASKRKDVTAIYEQPHHMHTEVEQNPTSVSRVEIFVYRIFLRWNDAEDELEQSSDCLQHKCVVTGVLESVEMAAVRNASQTAGQGKHQQRRTGMMKNQQQLDYD